MNLTLTKTTPTYVPASKMPVPDFDRFDGDQIADEMLMASAASTKVGQVSGGRASARQSADSRAWTKAGQVD